MTGYASRQGALQGEKASYQWQWEIKTVNGRSLDIRLRLPHQLNSLEQGIRKTASKKLSRGNVQLGLKLDVTGAEAKASLNEELIYELLSFSDKLHADKGIERLTSDGLFQVAGVVNAQKETNFEEDSKGLQEAVLKEFDTLVDDLILSRQTEGRALLKILQDIVLQIENLVEDIVNAPARQAENIQKKLQEQITQLLSSEHDFNEERLYQEALLLASKADVQEEIDRLKAHCAAANALFEKSEPIGRKLDFLAQEFNREANTLCSKANDISLTNMGLSLKALIEQFREQVQNVE